MIASAKNNGSYVDVYGENGGTLFRKSGSLVGFTSSTVTVKTGGGYYDTFDDKGRLKFRK